MSYTQRALSAKEIKALKSIRKPHFSAPEQSIRVQLCKCKKPILVKASVGLQGSIKYWCLVCGGELPLRQLDKLYDIAYGYNELVQAFKPEILNKEIFRATTHMISRQRQEQEQDMLQKSAIKEGEGGYEFLTTAEAKKYGGGKVVAAPRLVDTKFGEKLFVDLELKKGVVRTWSANNKSRNYLIDNIGNNENKWIGKKIAIVVVDQMIEGEMKKVVYAKGAVKQG